MKEYSKRIETERLILRKFEADDYEDMFNNYAKYDEVTKYLTWNTHKSSEDTKNYLEKVVLPDYEKEHTYRWAIELKSLGQVIGAIDVVCCNLEKKSAELGYVLGLNFWGNGIMTEAGRAVVDYLFSEGFVRIWAIHKVENERSGRVMQKLNMQYEGTLRKYALDNQGELVDVKIYSIIKQ